MHCTTFNLYPVYSIYTDLVIYLGKKELTVLGISVGLGLIFSLVIGLIIGQSTGGEGGPAVEDDKYKNKQFMTGVLDNVKPTQLE